MTVLRTSNYFDAVCDPKANMVSLLVGFQSALTGYTGYLARKNALTTLLQSDGSAMTAEQSANYRPEGLIFLSESEDIQNIRFTRLNEYFERLLPDPVNYGVHACCLVYNDLYRLLEGHIKLDPIVEERINQYYTKTKAEARDFLQSIREIYKDYPKVYNANMFTSPSYIVECSDYRNFYATILNGIDNDLALMDSLWKNTASLIKDYKTLVEKVYKPRISDIITIFQGTRYSIGSTSFKKKFPTALKNLREILGTTGFKQIGAE